MRLIINADDYGMTENISKGILQGMKEGIITDTSALTNSVHFNKSAELAQEAEITEMGVHLNLTFGKPVLDADQVRSIVDDDGNFYRKPGLIPSSYNALEVKLELTAQIEKFLATGLTLNHLDTHHGFSIKDAQMLSIVMELAKELNVPMRRDDQLSSELQGSIPRSGVKGTDMLCGDMSAPFVSEAWLKSVLEKYRDTNYTVEVAGHPGYSDEELRSISSLCDEREQDLALFMNKDIQQYIRQQGIELICYSQL